MDNFKTLKETEELVTDSKNRYKILDIMKNNIPELNLKDPRKEIKKIINSYKKNL